MKLFLVAAAALVTSCIGAPTTEKSLALRESHLVDAKAQDGTLDVKVDVQDLASERKGHKATTNVKRSNLARSSTRVSAKTKVAGFKNGDDLIDSLSTLLGLITAHSDTINATLLRVQAGKETRNKGTSDSLKVLGQVRTEMSSVLTRASRTRNLSLTSDQRDEVIALVDSLVQELIDIVNDLVETLGLRANLRASLNPLMNALTSLLEGLTSIDSRLSPELREGLVSIFRAQSNNTDSRGLDTLLSGVLNPLLRLFSGLNSHSNPN
ncbi:hypothetical protein F66182_5233 [Fusarium sp. NRRL 66182]|nr:hypothetical protein F66182_5233 [Fusarium sp. NRRL 66182]